MEPSKLKPAERAVLLEAVAMKGERVVIATLGVSRHAFARILAELPVRAGTLALVRSHISHLEDRDAEVDTR